MMLVIYNTTYGVPEFQKIVTCLCEHWLSKRVGLVDQLTVMCEHGISAGIGGLSEF